LKPVRFNTAFTSIVLGLKSRNFMETTYARNKGDRLYKKRHLLRFNSL